MLVASAARKTKAAHLDWRSANAPSHSREPSAAQEPPVLYRRRRPILLVYIIYIIEHCLIVGQFESETISARLQT